ncbi:hypothetical protein F5X99DRAFT_424108 [Biscogniauxia marginata]|nr:hypothetical protein F5X99DRAFT_424108 [Biscogniauxia marginata]
MELTKKADHDYRKRPKIKCTKLGYALSFRDYKYRAKDHLLTFHAFNTNESDEDTRKRLAAFLNKAPNLTETPKKDDEALPAAAGDYSAETELQGSESPPGIQAPEDKSDSVKLEDNPTRKRNYIALAERGEPEKKETVAANTHAGEHHKKEPALNESTTLTTAFKQIEIVNEDVESASECGAAEGNAGLNGINSAYDLKKAKKTGGSQGILGRKVRALRSLMAGTGTIPKKTVRFERKEEGEGEENQGPGPNLVM